MESDKLQDHMFATYTTLRIGVAIISLAFPLLLWSGGMMLGISIQDSMSAYYHAAANGDSMRNWFVGILFAVGLILYLYKGYSHQENNALNIAGIFAVCIAIFPTEWNCGKNCLEVCGQACLLKCAPECVQACASDCKSITMHGISALIFFLSVAYVCLFRASDTLDQMKDEARKGRYLKIYKLIGIGLILSPLTALLMTLILKQFDSYTFIAEAVGIWFFSTYWLVKSFEIRSTNAERLALLGEI